MGAAITAGSPSRERDPAVMSAPTEALWQSVYSLALVRSHIKTHSFFSSGRREANRLGKRNRMRMATHIGIFCTYSHKHQVAYVVPGMNWTVFHDEPRVKSQNCVTILADDQSQGAVENG